MLFIFYVFLDCILMTLIMNPRHFSFLRKRKITSYAPEAMCKQKQKKWVKIMMQKHKPWVYSVLKYLPKEWEDNLYFVLLYKKITSY